MTLARQLAERIDGDLRQFAVIPQSLAAMLSVRHDWHEEQLKHWMARMLEANPSLYGTCAAFESWEGVSSKQDFAVFCAGAVGQVHASLGLGPLLGTSALVSDAVKIDYSINVCRQSEKRLVVAPVSDGYRQSDWYSAAKQQRQGVWTEPFFVKDEDNKDVDMVTFTVPIWREERRVFAGVATADLRGAYFRGLNRLDEFGLGKKGYCFVLSPTGAFIGHPNPEYHMLKNINDVPAFKEGKAIQMMTRRILDHESNSASAIDPYTGKRSTFCFTPIPSAQWMLVLVIEE